MAPITLNILPKPELAPILMYFVMFPENPTALQHAITEHCQALLEQDDVSRFLGDVDGAIHRDADVCCLECRTVIDAVPQEPDDVPLWCRALMIAAF